MPINRNAILDLAAAAGGEGNENLKTLLLTVAGMLSPDGKVRAEPGPGVTWSHVSGIHGSYGLGLHHLQNRSRPVKAGR